MFYTWRFAQVIGRRLFENIDKTMTAALEGGEWSAARPGRTLPPGKTRYLFYRRLGGPQGRFGRAVNLVPIGIRSRTLHQYIYIYIYGFNIMMSVLVLTGDSVGSSCNISRKTLLLHLRSEENSQIRTSIWFSSDCQFTALPPRTPAHAYVTCLRFKLTFSVCIIC